MNPVPLTIEVRGIDEAAWTLQALRSTLANRAPLHAALAVEAGNFTRDYLRTTPRHKTAQALGATPTGFREKSAQKISAVSDADGAVLRIPRTTGLGRAFGDVTITPRPGRTYLTIPAHKETYGRGPRDGFPTGAFDFVIYQAAGGPCPALVWAETSGGHMKGDVAFWLRRSVTQKQDRTLLPSDAGYRDLGRRTCVAYIANFIYQTPA